MRQSYSSLPAWGNNIATLAEETVLEHLRRIQSPLHNLVNQVADTNEVAAAVHSRFDSFRSETRREFARIETRTRPFIGE